MARFPNESRSSKMAARGPDWKWHNFQSPRVRVLGYRFFFESFFSSSGSHTETDWKLLLKGRILLGGFYSSDRDFVMSGHGKDIEYPWLDMSGVESSLHAQIYWTHRRNPRFRKWKWRWKLATGKCNHMLPSWLSLHSKVLPFPLRYNVSNVSRDLRLRSYGRFNTRGGT